jgi:hypothetical protein
MDEGVAIIAVEPGRGAERLAGFLLMGISFLENEGSKKLWREKF